MLSESVRVGALSSAGCPGQSVHGCSQLVVRESERGEDIWYVGVLESVEK